MGGTWSEQQQESDVGGKGRGLRAGGGGCVSTEGPQLNDIMIR